MKQQILILDFRLGEVHIYDYVNPDATDQETILEELGHNASDCDWMIVDKLKLQIH